MAQRRSVLEPKPKVIYADDRTLIPRLNWLSWRTWAVFLGFNLAFAVTTTIVLLFCAYVIERWIRPMVAQRMGDLTSEFLTIIPMSLAVASLWYVMLRRVFPLRDTRGKLVPDYPKLDFFGPSFLLAFPWLLGFAWISIWAYTLAIDTVAVFAERSPLWVPGVAVTFSFMSFEIPFRVLWRAPAQEQERDD